MVFGTGDADADLMFVGEAPGANEDQQGLPFVGASGKLLAQLLEEIGLRREDVFIANVLKCRPPDNRDPLTREIDNCREYLDGQLALVRPKVVATLGNFATKLLRGDATGITRVHGRVEEAVIGSRRVRLLPLHHPAAALYQRSNLELLRADLAQVPHLLELDEPEQPVTEPAAPEARDPERTSDAGADAAAARPERAAVAPPDPADPPDDDPDDQLALF